MGIFDRFFRRKPKEKLRAGLLRSTQPQPRERQHFRPNYAGVSNSALITLQERIQLCADCKKEYFDNPYARNAARSFALGVYGAGPKLQVLGTESSVQIEKLFRKWRKATGLDGKMHTALESLFYDGEFFALIYSDPKVPGGLNFELIEPYRVRDPYGASQDPNRIEGITFDDFNRPMSYFIEKSSVNPMYATPGEFEEIPADRVIHFFLPDVTNQRRGIPMLQSVLSTLAALQRIGDASLGAWELAAKMNLYVQTPLEAYEFLQCVPKDYETGEENAIEAFQTIPIAQDGGITFLANGMTMGQVKSEHPTSQFHQSKAAYLSEVGAGVGQPRNVISADSSDYNFSSARLDMTQFYRHIHQVQGQLIPVLERLFLTAVASQADTCPEAREFFETYDQYDLPVEWYFPKIMDQLDRVDNADAEQKLVQSGLMTLREYCKRYGVDYDLHKETLENETAYTVRPAGPSGESEQPAEDPVRTGLLRRDSVGARDRDSGVGGDGGGDVPGGNRLSGGRRSRNRKAP